MSGLSYQSAKIALDDLVRSGKATVSKLFDLIDRTSGKVSNTIPSDVFLLQSGHLDDGSHASVGANALIKSTPGVHDVRSSPVGNILDPEKLLSDALSSSFFFGIDRKLILRLN